MTNKTTLGAGTTLLAMALGFAMMAPPDAQAGETFGNSANADASVFIPALEFRPINGACAITDQSDPGFFKVDDSILLPCFDSIGYADLDLPEGALITGMRASFFDNDPVASVSVSIRRHSIPLNGGTPTREILPGTITSSDSTAFQFPIAAVNATYDTFDTTGVTPLHWHYFVRAQMPAAVADVRLRGAWIFWRRQLAPAPASPTFSDVPTTHVFFSQIEQLSKSGITAGCGGGNYCPNASVTRGQMAVFLSKALGLHWDFSTDPAP